MTTVAHTVVDTDTLLKPFHTCIEALRAHHWQSYGDIYKGCLHGCVYCLYRYDDDFSKRITVFGNANTLLRKELEGRDMGITYIGPSSDVYQPIEKKVQLFRSLLEVFRDLHRPVFFSTKSTLVTRDIDLLSSLADEGLVEVSVTILGTNERISRTLEPSTPQVQRRLEAVKQLTTHGIPVSTHIAPYIPELYTPTETVDLIKSLKESGVSHVYGSVLGVRDKYWNLLSQQLATLDPQYPEKIASLYKVTPGEYDLVNNAQSLHEHVTFQRMKELRDVCDAHDLPFVCEEIPALTNTTLMGGIYRWKYPTVFDLVERIKGSPDKCVDLAELVRYAESFHVSDDYLKLIASLADSGELFLNTNVETKKTHSGVSFHYADNVFLGRGGVGTYE
jgi:DNA repair photolyase